MWILSLSIGGYPIVAAISEFLDIENQLISVPYRALILTFSTLIIISILLRKNLKLNAFWIVWWAFWALYLARLFVDGRLNSEALKLEEWEYWLWAVGVALVPAAALGSKYVSCIHNKTLVLITVLGVVGIVANLCIIYTEQNLLNVSDLIAIRAETKVLNPITLGHLAVTTLVLSGFRLLSKEKPRVIAFAFYSLAGVISLLGLLSSSSRGPVLSLLLVIIFIMITGMRKRNLLYAVAILVVLCLAVLFGSMSYDSVLLDRLNNSFFTDSIRMNLMQSGINVFFQNPIFGAGIEPLASYPHNVILESFMVFGVLSGALLIFLLVYSVCVACLVAQRGAMQSWIALLFVQYASATMVSGSLYSSSLLWILMAALVAQRERDIHGGDGSRVLKARYSGVD